MKGIIQKEAPKTSFFQPRVASSVFPQPQAQAKARSESSGVGTSLEANKKGSTAVVSEAPSPKAPAPLFFPKAVASGRSPQALGVTQSGPPVPKSRPKAKA